MVEKKITKKAPVKKTEVKKTAIKKVAPIKKSSSNTSKVIDKKVMNKTNSGLILSIVLGLFIIISAFQTFQINSLKTQIDNGGVKISGSSSGTTYGNQPSSSKTSTPSNIADLPQMVGGC